MVLERQILPLLEWLMPRINDQGLVEPGGLLTFVMIVAGLTVAGVFIAYLRMMLLLGPGEGFYAVAKSIAIAVTRDFPQTKFRRILAVTRLAIQESLRRRVLVVFFLFAIILLFAGWFLDPQSDHPARLYMSFVMTSTERLLLGVAILLAAFSLPNDIKNKTIYTVVTKPVRATELILGRSLGFCIVNSALLVLMCAASYGFVVRGLSHRHVVTDEDLEEVASEGQAGSVIGRTSLNSHHRHEVSLDAGGQGRSDRLMDHDHPVWRDEDGGYRVGRPEGALAARIPIYGKLRFTDRRGRPGRGISVGKEWTYRRYIEGGSLASGIWTFQGLRESQFEDSLPVEMTLSVFRTFKGDIVSGILGEITVKNPSTGLTSEPLPFTAREYVTYTQQIPRQLKAVDQDGTLRDVDLFADLVDQDGRVEFAIRCVEPAQYFGMAQADLYVRGRDGAFTWNFVKGYVGIWLQMVIITCFGVMFSTFLSGPVALFATAVVYAIGLFKEFVMSLATGSLPGGGPLEALIRVLFQMNVSVELDKGPILDFLVPKIDLIFRFFLWLAAQVFPDFTAFNTSRFVAFGFNIDGNLLAEHCLATLAFVIVLSVFSYFFLKSREVAA